MSDINITINGTKRLLTAGKYCDKNIVITPVGGGNFSGEYVIPVDELPTENIDENAVYLCKGAYYKYGIEFVDVYNAYLANNAIVSIKELQAEHNQPASFNVIPTKTTDGILSFNDGAHFYYIEDEDNVFGYLDGEWSIACEGIISDVSEIAADGLYALIHRGWTKYLAPTGTLEITESGTYDVSEYASAEVNVQGGDVQEYDGTITIS